MAYFPKQCVVVPVDFSAESLAAIEVGQHLVDQPEHLHVIHVLIDIAPLEAGEVWGIPNSQARTEQVELALREKLSGPQYAGIQTAVLVGEPAHGIANY